MGSVVFHSRFAIVGAIAACLLSAVNPVAVCAETLQEALTSAYRLNPSLEGERAGARAVDENVPIAKSATRPTARIDGDLGYERTENRFANGRNDPDNNNPRGYGVQVNQPVFRGFTALNSIRRAKAQVRQGWETLRSAEAVVLLDAVEAYVTVVRDLEIVRLNENNIAVLTKELEATKTRLRLGEVTRTDLGQAEARRSGAISDLNQARSNLKTSRGDFERVIGNPPGALSQPSSIGHLLPGSISEATNIGDSENSNILAAAEAEQAALHAVNVVIGQLLPEVDLVGRYQKRLDLSDSLIGEEDTSVMGRVSIPLYQGGEVAARTRQAKEQHFEAERQLEQARLEVRSQVTAAFGSLSAARAQIVSARAAVKSNQEALSGVREEVRIGQRTTLDALNAEQELLNSQVSLASFRRNAIFAEYSLLAAVGRLTAITIGLPPPYYDPAVHYELVRNQWFGLKPGGPLSGITSRRSSR